MDIEPVNQRVASIALSQIASEMQEVQPYKTIIRGEPPIQDQPLNYKKSTDNQRCRTIIHALTRANEDGVRPDPSEQNIPSFNGFQASLHNKQSATKAYFHKSYDQPPNKTVMRDIMNKQLEIIEEKKMPFAYICGDLPVYSNMDEIKGENRLLYKPIYPWIAPFHLQCVMIVCIYLRHKGSEFEEVLVQAGVIAAGSVTQALMGKHFRRGLRCIMLFYEALICKFLKENPLNLNEEMREKLRILRDTSMDRETREAAHDALLDDEELRQLVLSISEKMSAIGDMGDYWRNFFDMADALFQSVHSVHANDFDEYVNSMGAMMPWILGYDRTRYARHLPGFWVMLQNLPDDHYQFLKKNFALSITGNPYSAMAWDMWIETTMNKGSKLKSGWLSILKNEKQLLVHSRNVNNISRIRAVYNESARKKPKQWKHTESQPKRMKLDEQCVQDIVSCLDEYDSYPFDEGNTELRTLQSGVPASDELVQDFKTVLADSQKKLEAYLDERVYSKEKSIHARISRMKRKTFATSATIKDATNKKVKIAEMEQHALKGVIDLVQKSDAICLKDILQHRITT